jgi:hypothetical protein
MTEEGAPPVAMSAPQVPCQDQLDDLLERIEACPEDPTGIITQGKLLRRFVGLRQARAAAESLAAALKELEKEQELKVFDYLESDGVKTVNHDLGRFTRVMVVQGQVAASDKDAFMEWLRDQGLYEGMTRVQLLKSGLNELAKEMDRGERDEVPFLGAFTNKQVRFTPKSDS